MKEFILRNKQKIIKGMGAISFVVIMIFVFLSLTYLFREHQYNDSRITVVGIKEEKKDSLDMIYIGGSAAFTYWEPLHAFEDCGFTSYDLATNTIQAESILTLIKYARKYQNPELFVIGVRAFQYYEDYGYEVGLRVTSDALDLGMNRFSLINRFIKNRDTDADKVALHFDIAKYHTNYESLKNSTAWQLIDNSMQCDYKGGQIQTAWCYLEEPQNVKTDERHELIENDRKILIELLTYLKENDLNALFVVCPYLVTYEDYCLYNTIGDIVSEYGYGFLNTNDFYDEMGIDFATDFYNGSHVNSRGAEKYTDYLEEYISDNYALADHRGDDAYSDWQELADSYAYSAEESRATVQSIIDYAKTALSLGECIRKTDDFLEWAALVGDEKFTVISAGNCSFGAEDLKPQYANSLSQLKLSDVYGASDYYKIMRGPSVIATSSDGSSSIYALIGHNQMTTPCVVDVALGASICINNTEYSCGNDECINVVVFDNYHRVVVDSVYLDAKDGTIVVNRR